MHSFDNAADTIGFPTATVSPSLLADLTVFSNRVFALLHLPALLDILGIGNFFAAWFPSYPASVVSPDSGLRLLSSRAFRPCGRVIRTFLRSITLLALLVFLVYSRPACISALSLARSSLASETFPVSDGFTRLPELLAFRCSSTIWSLYQIQPFLRLSRIYGLLTGAVCIPRIPSLCLACLVCISGSGTGLRVFGLPPSTLAISRSGPPAPHFLSLALVTY